MTLARFLIGVVVIWFLVGAIALVQFHAGGSRPGDGRGDRMELSTKP